MITKAQSILLKAAKIHRLCSSCLDTLEDTGIIIEEKGEGSFGSCVYGCMSEAMSQIMLVLNNKDDEAYEEIHQYIDSCTTDEDILKFLSKYQKSEPASEYSEELLSTAKECVLAMEKGDSSAASTLGNMLAKEPFDKSGYIEFTRQYVRDAGADYVFNYEYDLEQAAKGLIEESLKFLNG